MIRPMRAMAAALLLALVGLPGACGTKAARDVCNDSGRCTSNALCPEDTPSTGLQCPSGMQDGSLCYYCTEGERLEAQQYECAGQSFQRRVDTDC